MTEGKHVEKPVNDRAKKMGIGHRKMNGMGQRAWPDQMYTTPYCPMFIEFKLPGEEPTPLQWEKITELRGLGYAVAVCDTKESGWLCLEWVHFKSGVTGVKTKDWNKEDLATLDHCFVASAEEYDKQRSRTIKDFKAIAKLKQSIADIKQPTRVGTKSIPKAGTRIPAAKQVRMRVGRPRRG